MQIEKEAVVKLQSLGEAHLYVAIAKIDGIVSKTERTFTGAHAVKSQKLYDVLKINSDIAQRVQNDIQKILNNPQYHAWNTNNHYEKALQLFKEAKAHGNWSVSLASLKHENGLLQVAMLDEYTFAESKAVKNIIQSLYRDLREVRREKLEERR